MNVVANYDNAFTKKTKPVKAKYKLHNVHVNSILTYNHHIDITK